MGYTEYLLKIEGEILDLKYCNNYKVTPARYTDKNSYVDGDGRLHRSVLPHTRSGISFNTGFITDQDILKLSGIFNNRIVAKIQYWNPMFQSYQTSDFYVPDIEFEVLMIQPGVVTYRPVNIELIEY